MGYETKFKLTICPRVDDAVQETFDYLQDNIAFDGTLEQTMSAEEDVLEFESKWYDYVKDMVALSSRFPGVFFKLHGVGEDEGDLWDRYFLGGRMQECPAQITYAPFDPRKLKTQGDNSNDAC